MDIQDKELKSTLFLFFTSLQILQREVKVNNNS